jgi:mutator protein MutT
MENCQSAKRFIAAAIIEKDGKILIAQRTKKDALFGKWEFPGGKVEPGETLQACLKRELFDELGIDAEIGEYFCTSTLVHKDIVILICAHSKFLLSGERLP